VRVQVDASRAEEQPRGPDALGGRHAREIGRDRRDPTVGDTDVRHERGRVARDDRRLLEDQLELRR
jgi:hypothetical protein